MMDTILFSRIPDRIISNHGFSRTLHEIHKPLSASLPGFGNRVWVNPSQQKGGYIQPSSFSSQGGSDWGSGRGGGGGGGGSGGGGRRENLKSSDFSFSSQNRFSALSASNAFDREGRGGTASGGTAGDEDDDKKL